MPDKLCFKPGIYQYWRCLMLITIIVATIGKPLPAQVINTTPEQNLQRAQAPIRQQPTPRQTQPPSTQPLPEPAPPTRLPPPEQLLPPPTTTPPTQLQTPAGVAPTRITVYRFDVTGSTVFSPSDFALITKPYTGRPIALAELFQLRAEITQLYASKGYITSGAYIPPQKLLGGVVEIRVVEGGLEGIKVTGTSRLNSGYVRSRLAIATGKPLNRSSLLRGLQLLQLNPLIQNLSAELSAGSRPGVSLLEVRVREAKTFRSQIVLDNGRSPAVGSFRRQIQLSEANLLGWGDGISAIYTNTDGSNAFDFNYTLPINPRNGTLAFNFGNSDSSVIEKPFSVLDIQSNSRYYELTLRQPVVQTPTQELALGITATRRESQASFLNGEIPFSAAEGGGGSRFQGKNTDNICAFLSGLDTAQQSASIRPSFSV